MNNNPLIKLEREREKNQEKTRQKQCEKSEAAQGGEQEQTMLESKNKVVELGTRQLFENQLNVWLTTSEAAAYLRVSTQSLLNMSSNGRIKYFKFGRRNRYLQSLLDKHLLENPKGGFDGY